MVYEIDWSPAIDDLSNLDSEVRKRIIRKVGLIAENPLHYVERLTGYPLFKLRVGDYRAIIDLKISRLQIIIVLVAHRSKVYQELKRRY